MSYKLQKQYRCQGYDYSQDGFYFLTICCKNREMFFGTVETQHFASAPKMQLSEIGKIAEKFWLEIPNHFSSVRLDEFIIMPNHIHGIIEINNQTAGAVGTAGTAVFVGTGHCPVPTNMNMNANNAVPANCPVPTNTNTNIVPTVPANTNTNTHNGSTFGHVTAGSISVIIGSFKSITTKTINLKFRETGFAWQARFHDRIIRNNGELNRIRRYILANPKKWAIDRNNLEDLYM